MKFAHGQDDLKALFCLTWPKPASVAQLDTRLTGDQEIAGSMPTRSAIFFYRE